MVIWIPNDNPDPNEIPEGWSLSQADLRPDLIHPFED